MHSEDDVDDLPGSETPDRVSEGVVVLDSDLVYTDANERALELLDRDREELVGEYVWDAFPNAEETTAGESIAAAIETGDEVTYERYSDDLGRWFESRVYPDSDGATLFFRDVTVQKEREQERERAETLFENAQDAFFLVDVDSETGTYTIERVNPAFESLTGLPKEDIEGEVITEVFDARGSAGVEARYRKCVEQREPLQYVEQLPVPEESSYWETRIAPVIVDDEVVQIVGATRNITERMVYERQLEQQRDGLEVLNQMVRHDIRNNLQVIQSYGELLATRVGEEDRDYVDRILQNAKAAVEVTRTARDLSETMLQTEASTEPVALRRVLLGQIDEIRMSYTDAIVTVDGQVPSVGVVADDLLASVFRNIIKNAIQHNGKEVPEVNVAAVAKEDHVHVTVADNGPGIPDGQKAEIFGKGEKGLESEGTGIGLYLVKTLVDRYGGRIQVHDNEPEGAVVNITLQRARRE